MHPDAFLNDWYGFATNQMAHALLGLAITAIVAWAMRRATGLDMEGPALVVVGVVYFIAWEGLYQLWGAGIGDAIADTAFITLGGAVGVSAWLRRAALLAGSMLAITILLICGILTRI